nr:centromere protein R isoform X2 [Equus caballus]
MGQRRRNPRPITCVKRSLKLDGLLEANALHLAQPPSSLRQLLLHTHFQPSKRRSSHQGKPIKTKSPLKHLQEITRKNVTAYSPTTGTCQMSPFASPTSSKEGEHESGPSNGKRKKLNCLSLTQRKEATTKDSDEFMVLLSKVEKSSEEIMEIMQNLSSIQALEGSRELENLLGISRASCFLREMQKTKELMTKATKQKLFEKKSSGLPNKELRHLDSYEFLKAILN